MRLIRNRRDAWWAPARFDHAFFRLMALVIASRLREERMPGIVRVADRQQNPIESYAIAVWCLVTCSLYFAALLAPLTGWLLAALLSMVLGAIAIHVLVVSLGMVLSAIAGAERDRTDAVVAALKEQG